MQNVRIVTHSGCDLTFAEARNNGIVMLPDLVVFGGEQYRNNVDIGPETFYRRLEEDAVFPTSAHPSLSEFIDAFRAAGDCQDIVCIVMSSKMTGTINTVNIAAQMLKSEGFGPRIHVYDSRQVSFGMGMAVLRRHAWPARGQRLTRSWRIWTIWSPGSASILSCNR